MTTAAIYLDHNASAPLLPEARAAISDALEMTGNPSSVHSHGRALRAVIELARDRVALCAGAGRSQVVFTGSATEAITQAIAGGARTLGLQRIILSAGEHEAVLKAAEMTGLPTTRIGLTADGLIDLDALATSVTAAGGRGLVAVHAVNNETGVIQPLAEIGALVNGTPHILFVDAVQALGKLPLGFAQGAADMMALSGHKIGGPAGVGALLLKDHTDGVRLIPGGGQEQNRRGGTEAAALIAGFGAAAEAFHRHYDAGLVREFATRVDEGVASFGGVVFGTGARRVGNTSAFAVRGLTSAVAMMGLDLMGVSISSGSACSSGKVGQSHVLKAMGVDTGLLASALRVSLGWTSTETDVDAFLSAFAAVIDRHQRGRAA